jgi:hypothetical protein
MVRANWATTAKDPSGRFQLGEGGGAGAPRELSASLDVGRPASVRGALVPNISGSMGSDCGPRRRRPAERAVCFRSLLVDPSFVHFGALNLLSTMAVPNERDLAIKCGQSALSE